MRLLARLEDERQSYALWYVSFRQSPEYSVSMRTVPVPIHHRQAARACTTPDWHSEATRDQAVRQRDALFFAWLSIKRHRIPLVRKRTGASELTESTTADAVSVSAGFVQQSELFARFSL